MSICDHNGYSFNRVQALLCSQAIEMWQKYKMQMTRGFTISDAMKMAAAYTGKKYKKNEYDTAIADLKKWMEQH